MYSENEGEICLRKQSGSERGRSLFHSEGSGEPRPSALASYVTEQGEGGGIFQQVTGLHAQLYRIKAIVQLCSTIGQLQLSDYTWRCEKICKYRLRIQVPSWQLL